MQSARLWALELGIAALTLFFTVLWLLNKDGVFEPLASISSAAGTAVVHVLRRRAEAERVQGGGPFTLRAESRFIISKKDATLEEVWAVLTRPFLERHESWHPSYSDFEPVSIGKDGHPREFEVRGSAGGRYPWRIEEWNEADRLLRTWKGPSKSPPGGAKNTFLGLTFNLRLLQGVQAVLIEIWYEARWTTQPWPTRDESFENGPKREIEWIFRRFPIRGEIEYIREADPLR